jgi:hypothetical protein
MGSQMSGNDTGASVGRMAGRFRGRAKAAVMLCGLTLVMSGCAGSSGSGGGGGGGIPAPTASLSVTPTVILLGQHVTLAWASTNADEGTVDALGVVGLNGSTALDPNTTTTYTYTATGPGGSATATATVTVGPVTFDGMTQADGVKNADGTSNEDVDANGAVGTKQFLEYVNTSLQAYDKVTQTPVWPSPKLIGTLWPTGDPCNSSPNGKPSIQLDAHIIFDRLASRWVVAAKTTNANVGYYFCIAVSSTDDLSDPSLNWHSYHTGDGYLDTILGQSSSGTYFPDWPKIGTWTDATGKQSAYYAAMDMEDVLTFAESGAVVCALDRTGLLGSGAVKPAACVKVSDPNNLSMWNGDGLFLAHSLIPADIDGTTVPPAGRDEVMLSIQNPADGEMTSASLNLWQFHLDWNAATPLTWTQTPLPVTAFTPGCYLIDPTNVAITNCVLEPYHPEFLDSVGDRLMPRLSYRNFGGYESYLISQAVQTGPGASGTTPSAYQTGIQWYELRTDGTGVPSLFQSGTINPDETFFRFLPSIAQDKKGNVAAGYSLSNYFAAPEIDLSYWSLTDSSIVPAEFTIYNQGLGNEVTLDPPYAGRWGSYSSMTVDPVDDCTFWYVNEYFVADGTDPTGNTWRTRIASFQLPGCQ